MSDISSSHIPTAKKQDQATILEGATLVQASAISKYSEFHKTLLDGFNKDFIGQNDRLLETAKSLLTLQIAMPGLYAALLKLIEGDKAVLAQSDYLAIVLVISAFLFWLLGMGLSLMALKPIAYSVNPAVLSREGKDNTNDDSLTGLLDLYQKSASRKYSLIVFSSILTVLGLALMILNLMFY